MKKVKITVLKTTFQEDLAKEYGIDDLGVCPILNEGEVYYGIGQSLKAFVMKHGKQYISMYLHCLTVLIIYFIMGIGLKNQV